MSTSKTVVDQALGLFKGRKSPFIITVLAMAGPIALDYFGKLSTLTLTGILVPACLYLVLYALLSLFGKQGMDDTKTP